jgi:hypothetical protein
LNNINLCVLSVISTKKDLASSSKDIFIHFNHMPLTRYQFTSVLKKALNFLNIKKGHFRSHSFRIGGATELARQGVQEKEIMKLGLDPQWISKMLGVGRISRFLSIKESKSLNCSPWWPIQWTVKCGSSPKFVLPVRFASKLAHCTIELKTDQNCRSVKLCIPGNGKIYCPLELIKNYLLRRSCCSSENLFIHFNHMPLTRYQVFSPCSVCLQTGPVYYWISNDPQSLLTCENL